MNVDTPTHVPTRFQEPVVLGIDEAGRGPVLGPMVYAVAWAPLSHKETFAKKGFKDSKQLKESDRERLFSVINADPLMDYLADVITPEEISAKMLKKQKVSLNRIAMDSVASLLRRVIDSGIVIAEMFVDTLGPPKTYHDFLKSICPKTETIVVESKADAKYPIVSAASICAKVTRDHALRDFRFKETVIVDKEVMGTGYPGDATTRKFLASNFDRVFLYPSICRFSWKTVTPDEAKGAVSVEWKADEENEELDRNQPQLFLPKRQQSGRCYYFEANSLDFA
ncbi:putative Ribonuclease H2 subunit A [Blattamonas nauphoetae]|uniref:Ribonuclease n=1 Tax=Blattamonas nauphoetae TaxID=2049346 RepID=A0ABQ9Y4C3_9EUKA|nr:putative Ribonuclease H2 subunit A [Blattamonas nauphoetae]